MTRGKRLSELTINKIKELRRQGYRIKYICKVLGINKNSVVKYSKIEESK